MASRVRFARLGVAAALGLACTTAWGVDGMMYEFANYCTVVLPAGIGGLNPVTTATPAGTWQGTAKCDGKFQGDAFSKLSLTIPITMVIASGTPFGMPGAVVCNRFAGIPADVGLLPPGSIEGVVYTGAYFPDAPGATKGTLGFGTDLSLLTYGEVPYIEAGQGKLEGKKDGTVTLKGKSYAIGDSQDFNGAVSATCDWNLKKISDDYVPLEPPG